MNETTGSNVTGCFYCGLVHNTVCPRIEEIEYYPNGTTKRVKLRTDTYTVTISEDEPDQYDVIGHICGVDCPQNTDIIIDSSNDAVC